MANSEHLEILKQGVATWNAWREKNPQIWPDLREADLRGSNLAEYNLRWAFLIQGKLEKANLQFADLSRTDLRGVDLQSTNLRSAQLRLSNLSQANLKKANLSRANCTGAQFSEAHMQEVNLGGANLRGVNFYGSDMKNAFLSGATLSRAIFLNTDLSGSDLTNAVLLETNFGATNLKKALLDDCIFRGPCVIDQHTLQGSGDLPRSFLTGCGLSDRFIDYLPSLFNESSIQFYSCFISHSTKDHLFAERLYNDLQGNGVRCWYAPEEMKGGEKLYDQIDSAIRVHDKLLLVLSEHSLKSEWVLTEIRRCRKSEKREGKRKLFPIRLVDMETIQEWECFDADSGKDLAVEVREFFLPDFSHWKDHDTYQKAFSRLMRDLKESARKGLDS